MYFRSCDLKNLPFFSPPVVESATSLKIWTFSAFLYISETTRTIVLQISSHNLHNVYLPGVMKTGLANIL